MKEKILELAGEQIKKGGYAELSFAAIAKELGISRANIHHHYSSKAKLAEAVLLNYIDKKQKELSELVETTDGNFVTLVGKMEQLICQSYRSDNCCSCACSPLMTMSEKVPQNLKTISSKYFDRKFDFLRNLIKQAKEEGQFRTDRTADEITCEFRLILSGYLQVMMFETMNYGSECSHLKGSLVRWAKYL